jgi:DoxX-like protein
MKDMKRDKIIYWIATGLLTLSLALAGFSYLISDKAAEAFRHLGFPSYFRVELGVAKIIGALALVLPAVPGRIKAWAYVGAFIVFVSAFIAHLSVDNIATALQPLFAFCLCGASVFFFNKINADTLKSANL